MDGGAKPFELTSTKGGNMKLELFSYVDQVLSLRDQYEGQLEEIGEQLVQYFQGLFTGDDRVLNVAARVKTPQSLREKIIRRNYFSTDPDPEECFKNIPDLVGVRIECRFNKDEKQIYHILKNNFRIYCGKGMYCNKANQQIELNLESEQPQVLSNGFKLFKFDGIYHGEEGSFPYELQIKSMVNLFWGEIDHKILYKNYNYMITEDFFRDIMSSIIDNLAMVDRQLMILYDHVSSLDASANISAQSQLKVLLSKIIHDVFVNKVYDELGFVFDLKNTTDIMVDYLFMKCKKNKELSYGENFISLINRINSISESEMNLEEYIVFKEIPKFPDDFTREIGTTLIQYMNSDFEWNIFFKILGQLNEDSMCNNVMDFLYFICYEMKLPILEVSSFCHLSEEESSQLEDLLLSEVAKGFKAKPKLHYIFDEALPMIRFHSKEMISKGVENFFEIRNSYKKIFKR